MRRVLSVSFDGILQPLGFSQVARVAMGLATSGIPYALASLERARDLADAPRLARTRSLLERAGVLWEPAEFAEGGGPDAIARNVARLTRASLAIARRAGVRLVHARAFPGGLVATALRHALRLPYVFDARAYWVDEQVESGRRFTSPLAYRTAKLVERTLFGDSDGIVTLTELQANDLREGRCGARAAARPVTVIPTAADYDEFVLRETGVPRPDALARFAGDAPVMAIVGALNRSYDEDATARLARAALDADPAMKLVVLSSQEAEHRAVLDRAGVQRERVLITSVPHHEISAWMAHIDWGILLLRSPFAKRASMPTKLAEFFACGVRPIQHGCNDEVSEWVRTAGSGLVLTSLDRPALESAAGSIPSRTRDRAAVRAARDRTREHFSLATAIHRYRDVLA